MHDTARETGAAFFQTYSPSFGSILDVGSLDVNGTLRPFVPAMVDYCGVDIADGPNVNVKLNDPYFLPFGDETFNLIVSSSCLEHDPFFWLTFAEMARVVCPTGFIYLNVPTGGNVHRHPVDCWRFYPDCGIALAQWAERNGHSLQLIESFIRPPKAEGWSDFTAVWSKRPHKLPSGRLHRAFKDAVHVHDKL